MLSEREYIYISGSSLIYVSVTKPRLPLAFCYSLKSRVPYSLPALYLLFLCIVISRSIIFDLLRGKILAVSCSISHQPYSLAYCLTTELAQKMAADSDVPFSDVAYGTRFRVLIKVL